MAALVSCRQGEPGANLSPHEVKRFRDSISRLDSLAVACMNSDTLKAREYANRAVSLATLIGIDESLIRALGIKGLVLKTAQDDSARYYLNLALRISDTSAYKKSRGMVFYNISQIYQDVNDFENAAIFLDSAIQTGYRNGEFSAVAVSLCALGEVYQAIDDFARAIATYDSALAIAQKHSLNREKGVVMGNLARFQPNTDSALYMLRVANYLLEALHGTELERANILINSGMLQTNQDSAIYYYHKAIALGRQCRLPVVLMGGWNNLAYVYLERHDVKKATEYLLQMAIPLAGETGNYDWLSTLYDSYADVLIEKRAFWEAVDYLRKSTVARGISDRQVAKKQVRLLNALLDLNHKNLVILEKEQQITLRDASNNLMKFWLALAGAILLLMVFGLFWFRQRARNRMQVMKLESARKVIEAEENEKEKNGMELHDAISILGSKVNTAIEEMPPGNDALKETISRHVCDFSEEVRAISHQMSSRILERHAFVPLLTNLCQESMKFGNLNMVFEIGDPNGVLPAPVRLHVYRIIQEMLNNARKYAVGAAIELRVVFRDHLMEVIYHDTGPGFSVAGAAKKGMGFSNIFARANLLNGKVELDAEAGHGVYWRITIPC